MFDALGWCAEQRLGVPVVSGALAIVCSAEGELHLDRDGYLRIPLRVRRRSGIRTGDRLLLAADTRGRRLLVFPPPTIDQLFAGRIHELGQVQP
ncbi:hypothetical protein [Nocardia noduli]|uniref:hypothetical protein n=1 Tax=Nocardia noduli TaxID=2815722 RepID=UPI001C23116A|nr:hypothetical protein [Nocardia noduli]